MIKINRSMVGGVAVAGLLLSNSLVLANPTVTAKPDIMSVRLQAPLIEGSTHVFDQRFQVFSQGIPGWEKQVVANAKDVVPPAKVIAAQSQASSLKAGAKVQVASRGAAPKV
ncbi:MAG TPA: hypothetical protein VNU93_05255, partial [Verrucomicrobiae bacterium]|nr:hypothetical protein [Verrucomicrobiae bacterium]